MKATFIALAAALGLTAALGAVGAASFDGSEETGEQPRLFLPDVLDPAGRLTLTPGFSPDGQTIYFAQTECTPIWECPQRLKRIVKDSGGWTAPETVPLPQDVRVDYPSVTPDGKFLLFSWAAERPEYAGRDISENFDLWRLDLTDRAARPKPLQGPDLNRVREGAVKTLRFVNNETAPVLTREGDLYFWSERLDGMGERDIYRARSAGDGRYERPELLPAPVNSSGRDDGSWVSPDGKTMLITYPDRGGCGGNDLFIAFLEDGEWTEPVNLGCSINSPQDELAATLVPGTNRLIFPSNRPFDGSTPATVALWTAQLPAKLAAKRDRLAATRD